MASTTFSGPVKSKNGFVSIGTGMVIATAVPITLTVAEHAGRIVQIIDADGVITLPTLSRVDDDSNNMGAVFRCYVSLLPATNLTFVAAAANPILGQLTVGVSAATSGKTFFPAGTDHVITLNGSTKGGLVGSHLEFTAVMGFSNSKWIVTGDLNGSGSTLTPFSTT
jgi:hypothetical protein